VGDEHQGVATGLDGLVHGVLDQRPVDDRQHLLGYGLGRREKTGAQSGDGEYGLANPLAHQILLASRAGNGTTTALETCGRVASMGVNSGMTSHSTWLSATSS